MRSEELRRFRFGRARCDEDGQAPVGRLWTDMLRSVTEKHGGCGGLRVAGCGWDWKGG